MALLRTPKHRLVTSVLVLALVAAFGFAVWWRYLSPIGQVFTVTGERDPVALGWTHVDDVVGAATYERTLPMFRRRRHATVKLPGLPQYVEPNAMDFGLTRNRSPLDEFFVRSRPMTLEEAAARVREWAAVYKVNLRDHEFDRRLKRAAGGHRGRFGVVIPVPAEPRIQCTLGVRPGGTLEKPWHVCLAVEWVAVP